MEIGGYLALHLRQLDIWIDHRKLQAGIAS